MQVSPILVFMLIGRAVWWVAGKGKEPLSSTGAALLGMVVFVAAGTLIGTIYAVRTGNW